ncbi:MAG: HAMP domain-containing histidine kinase, partial [Ignavibacteriales bacterium]|nr:HAMP domain-containing histidine kinase [Ignavibacteriales bacterium]
AEMYFQEGNQRLHREFARFIADLLQPYTRDTLEQSEIIHVFEQVHTMNPSVEIYLLDEGGNILSSSTARENLKLDRVAIEPIQRFIAVDGKQFTMGEDPKGLHKEKVFTAAPFLANGKQVGYVYVILGGEEYDSALQFIQQNYILRLGVRTLFISLIAAAIIGLVSLGFLTRRLRRMTNVVTAFGAGDLSQRITIQSDDEIGMAARAFNQMADTIQRHVDELAAVDSLRRELVANISHDLRTPLSSMQGYVETVILKNNSLTGDERRQYLQTILDSTVKLNKLVQELFELSKLDAKQTLPKPEPFSLTELVQDVSQKFQPQAEKNSIHLEMQFDKDLPYVFADIGLIERVLQNLLENALKFTPKNGRVAVFIELVDAKLKVHMTDTGCGIPESDIPNIFDRFYRSSRNRSRNDGAGLGLAIVKRVLELHDENISVESSEQTGSTFTFALHTLEIVRYSPHHTGRRRIYRSFDWEESARTLRRRLD